MSTQDLDQKFERLLDKLSIVSGNLASVVTNVTNLSKSLETYQEKLDIYIKDISGEISDIKQDLAVSNSKLSVLEQDKEKRSTFNMRSVLTVMGAICAFMVSITTNIVLLFLKK